MNAAKVNPPNQVINNIPGTPSMVTIALFDFNDTVYLILNIYKSTSTIKLFTMQFY